MAKTKEELNQLKEEFESLTTKLKELTEDELKQISGGLDLDKIQILDKKLEDYYRQGLISMDDYLEVHQALWSGDDYKIHSAIYPKITGPDCPWTKLYLDFKSY